MAGSANSLDARRFVAFYAQGHPETRYWILVVWNDHLIARWVASLSVCDHIRSASYLVEVFTSSRSRLRVLALQMFRIPKFAVYFRDRRLIPEAIII